MAASDSGRITIDVPWRIEAPESVMGNDGQRFDTQRQSDTLGPQPPPATDGPEETNGEPGGSPKAPE